MMGLVNSYIRKRGYHCDVVMEYSDEPVKMEFRMDSRKTGCSRTSKDKEYLRGEKDDTPLWAPSWSFRNHIMILGGQPKEIHMDFEVFYIRLANKRISWDYNWRIWGDITKPFSGTRETTNQTTYNSNGRSGPTPVIRPPELDDLIQKIETRILEAQGLWTSSALYWQIQEINALARVEECQAQLDKLNASVKQCQDGYAGKAILVVR